MGMSSRNFFMQRAHDDTSHEGLDTISQNLTDNMFARSLFQIVRNLMDPVRSA